MKEVTVIGGGLAGCECALTLAKLGVDVILYEQRPQTISPAHHSDMLAELVCSNSLKSEKLSTAAGLLKWELKKLGSSLIDIAYKTKVAAGGSLAVDREMFSFEVTKAIENNSHITLVREEVTELPSDFAVIATGPLCSDALFKALQKRLGAEALSFYDAAAPIIDAQSIDMDVAFTQSRYETGTEGDYINCPMTQEIYDQFVYELINAKRVISRDFEDKDLFSACQPIEEVARVGHNTLAFGALKPVGIIDPKTGNRPWANVQLRSENSYKTSYNLVGFQTNLTWSEQKRVFRLIPGLEKAEFLRFGVMHRNSFVDSPHVLAKGFRIPGTTIRLAGQITGTEGYTEAIASGLFAALNTYCNLIGIDELQLPHTGAFGSLVRYSLDTNVKNYQPMHVQMGLMEPLKEPIRKKDARRQKMVERAQADLLAYIEQRCDVFGSMDE